MTEPTEPTSQQEPTRLAEAEWDDVRGHLRRALAGPQTAAPQIIAELSEPGAWSSKIGPEPEGDEADDSLDWPELAAQLAARMNAQESVAARSEDEAPAQWDRLAARSAQPGEGRKASLLRLLCSAFFPAKTPRR
jgi:hypothetical protein